MNCCCTGAEEKKVEVGASLEDAEGSCAENHVPPMFRVRRKLIELSVSFRIRWLNANDPYGSCPSGMINFVYLKLLRGGNARCKESPLPTEKTTHATYSDRDKKNTERSSNPLFVGHLNATVHQSGNFSGVTSSLTKANVK